MAFLGSPGAEGLAGVHGLVRLGLVHPVVSPNVHGGTLAFHEVLQDGLLRLQAASRKTQKPPNTEAQPGAVHGTCGPTTGLGFLELVGRLLEGLLQGLRRWLLRQLLGPEPGDPVVAAAVVNLLDLS